VNKPEEWSCVMPFLDGSETYVFGFELGVIWHMCTVNTFPEAMLMHVANIKQLELVAAHFDCDLFVDNIESAFEWCEITMVKKTKPELSIIK
jgi:hypothetical protein